MPEGENSHESEIDLNQIRPEEAKEKARLEALEKLKIAKKNYRFNPSEESVDDLSQRPQNRVDSPHWTDIVEGQ